MILLVQESYFFAVVSEPKALCALLSGRHKSYCYDSRHNDPFKKTCVQVKMVNEQFVVTN